MNPVNMRRFGMTALTVLAALAAAGVAARAEEYGLDPARSRVGFAVRHVGIGKARGEFRDCDARITFSEEGAGSLTAEAVIRVGSVDTGWKARNEYILGPSFFDAARFPEIRFKTAQAQKRNGIWIVTGAFTMRGVTRELQAPVTVTGPFSDPRGRRRVRLRAVVRINRKDYGVGSDKFSDRAVGEEVTLELDVEAVAPADMREKRSE